MPEAKTKGSIERLNEAFLTFSQTKREEDLEEVLTHGRALIYHFIKNLNLHEHNEDLMQTGYEGLMQAVRRFDPEKGAKFSTFAFSYIRGYMYKEARRQLRDRPRWIPSTQARVLETAVGLAEKSEDLPSLEDVAKEMNVKPEGIREIMKASVVSLEDLDKRTLQSLTHKSFSIPLEDQILLSEALHKLSKIQQQVIYLLFYKDLTQQEAGQELNLSRSKVYRIAESAVEAMKRTFR